MSFRMLQLPYIRRLDFYLSALDFLEFSTDFEIIVFEILDRHVGKFGNVANDVVSSNPAQHEYSENSYTVPIDQPIVLEKARKAPLKTTTAWLDVSRARIPERHFLCGARHMLAGPWSPLSTYNAQCTPFIGLIYLMVW